MDNHLPGRRVEAFVEELRVPSACRGCLVIGHLVNGLTIGRSMGFNGWDTFSNSMRDKAGLSAIGRLRLH